MFAVGDRVRVVRDVAPFRCGDLGRVVAVTGNDTVVDYVVTDGSGQARILFTSDVTTP